MSGRVKLAILAAFSIACANGAASEPQKIGAPPEASNMKLVGYNDLQARSAYQPTIHHQGDRWIAYIGHHGGTDDIPAPVNPQTGKAEPNGTSIVDVTDPANPKYLRHIPGQEGKYEAGGAQMVRICDGKQLPKGDRNAVYMLRTLRRRGARDLERRRSRQSGADHAARRLEGHPQELVGMRHRHRVSGFRRAGLAHPAHDAGLRSQRSRPSREDPRFRLARPGAGFDRRGADRTARPDLDRAAGNRVYFGYGTNKGGFMQIVDRDKLINGPKEPTPDNLRLPEISRMPMSALNGAHTTFPMLNMPIAEFAKDKDGKNRDIVMIVDEAILNECNEPRQMVWFADVTVENRPMMISSYTVPEASGDFCERGGRFGSHSSNESMAPVYYKKMAFIAFFNAGVRALDIRDPYHPKEVGYFIPSITAATDKRCVTIDGKDRCKVAIQTNNVETDERGYVYIVDRANTGLHILELTGPARAAAGLP